MKDEGIMEIRAIRHQISEEFDHDIQKYIAFLQSQAGQYDAQLRLAEQMLLTQKPEEETRLLRKAA